MEIKGLSVAQKYAAARPATEPNPATGAMAALKGVATDFAAALAEGEQTSKAAMIGGADPHSLVTALAQTELVVETAVTVRNKVVEAYQEILRMPV
ncbi:Flagellar hook-basal body complex protein FliE [Sulfitobacter noctilucae]|uniref:flagellar hook-basal body complex protein FliE n=1 Tax=Sulfitobacter noctilucae TaxID=1342302 RepID=UPI00046AD0D6|nr:flagellar hook-basal body complex protein FliE [Sulfitobacter noctilucae]KIN65921.1 Flagellar hook-basal body complex protein FliE [Sulfitobacter noctilucae]